MGRWTKPNKTTRTPSVFVFVDTETTADPVPGFPKRKIHTLRLGHARSFRLERGRMTRRKSLDFTAAGEFWEWLIAHLSGSRPVQVYAHNISFDLTVLSIWELIENSTFTLRRFVNNDPPVIVRAEHERGRVDFIDSLNWFQCPLSQIAADLGMVKPAVDFDECSELELWEYCRNDVRVLEKRIFTLLTWIRENELGVMQRTAPSQAMQAARHRFLPRVTVEKQAVSQDGVVTVSKTVACYPLLHQCDSISRLERMAYFGGEARLFRAVRIVENDSLESVARFSAKRLDSRVIEGPVYHLDVNSLYPYVMQEYKYPCKFLQRVDNPSVEALQKATVSNEVVAHVEIRSACDTFPTRASGNVCYAVGHFWASLCGGELRYAIRKGYVSSCLYMLLYETADLFSDYVDYFYPLKQQYVANGDGSSAALCKMMLNSLQAKWAQKAYKWIDVPGVVPALRWGMWPEPDPETGETVWCRGIGSHKQVRGPEGDGKDSFISIPACVCANARQFMREARILAGEKNVLYQHTDSLHVTGEGRARLERGGRIDDNRLGSLRLVETIRAGEYRGVNDYDANGRKVQAGINWRKVYSLDRKKFIDRFQGSATIINDRPAKGVFVESELVNPYAHCYQGRIDKAGWVHPVRLGG